MKSSKYANIPCLCQVIGSIYKNPKLLEKTDEYKFNEQDFFDSFHQMIFGCLYNLYQLGAKDFSLTAIEDYLTQRPKKLAEYKVNKGAEYILKCAETANILTFDFYYNKMKKLSLLRAYEDMGMNLDWLYNPDDFNTKKVQEQEDWLDNSSLEDISNEINSRIDSIKMEFVDQVSGGSCGMGDGIDELLQSLESAPALGYPLFGKFINTVTRGARLGKFFLRSASTGVGKTRSMIADACFIGCSQMYDNKINKWVSIGTAQPVLFIATEQDRDECQTMCLSFISGVDEEHILKSEYYTGEIERITKASLLLKQSKIQFVCLPDFSMEDVENTIKKSIRDYETEYIFFDYIHSSAKILTEVGGKSGVRNLREDNILFLLSSKLKDIAVQYGVFVLSSTQLNGQYQESETPDQNLLRGSKAIADRIDMGMIMMDVTKDDLEKLRPFCIKNNIELPNVKMSIYKNRQGKWKNIYLWMNADKATCRYDAAFVTDFCYQLIEMEDLKIKVEEPSIF